MRFVVFGAGGVGGVVGGRLAQHGHDVALIARGAHYEAIRAAGLRIESPDGITQLRIDVFSHPSQVAWTPDDVVLLAVKTQDTARALDALAAAAPPSVPVACLQNGVANERIALRRFANVYGVCVWCPSGHLNPGIVQAWSAPTTGILDIGRYPAGTDEVAGAVARAFGFSTFHSQARADIMRLKYWKLLSNLGNAVEALCGSRARDIQVLQWVREEATACFAAAGIAAASSEEASAGREAGVTVRPIAGQGRPGGSTWQSLARGAGTTECDYLNGEIVLLGRIYGVETPVNGLLQRLAREAAERRTPPGSISVADLESMASDEARSLRSASRAAPAGR